MRVFLLFSLLLCVFLSCEKENAVACIDKRQNSDWETIVFKYDYTIQLPSDYRGIGAIGFEGFVFSKYRADSSVVLKYSYCSPTYCAPFGQLLSTPEPPSVTHIFPANRKSVILDKKVQFCEGDSVVALFYYNNPAKRFGKLYMQVGGDFREAVEIEYNANRQSEVEAILKTIKEK